MFAAAVPVGCTLTRPIPADVRVPPEVLRGSQYGDTSRTRYYVVRMTDGRNDWEVQVPELATSYEYKIPLSGKPSTRIGVDMPTLTAADREIIQQREADARAEAGTPEPSSDEGPMKRASTREDGDGDGKPAPKRAARKPGDNKASTKNSYLLTLARVKDLYRAKQYELALVELAELDRQYPDDEHILSMKGSLYERLGNIALAREAWQSALRINSNNLSVMDALDRLNKKEKGRE